MTRIKAKNILLVAPAVISDQLFDSAGEEVRHVTKTAQIFPALFESIPDLIIFDYDFLGHDFERILRRIRTNVFYKKVKICCYKQTSSIKTDSLLATLGVDYFLYEKSEKIKRPDFSLPESISSIFDNAVLNVAVQ